MQSNILVNDYEEACICDFGLSTVVDVTSGRSITNTSSFAGNVRWMAPELFVRTDKDGNLSRVSARTDVYSFGRVALEVNLLTMFLSNLKHLCACRS